MSGGIDIMIGGSQKATMIPPGLAFASVSEKAWKGDRKSEAAALLLRLRQGAQESVQGGIELHSRDFAGGMPPRCPELHSSSLALKNLIGNAALLAAATREAATALGLTHFAVSSPANAVTSINAPAGIESTKVVKEMRSVLA